MEGWNIDKIMSRKRQSTRHLVISLMADEKLSALKEALCEGNIGLPDLVWDAIRGHLEPAIQIPIRGLPTKHVPRKRTQTRAALLHDTPSFYYDAVFPLVEPQKSPFEARTYSMPCVVEMERKDQAPPLC